MRRNDARDAVAVTWQTLAVHDRGSKNRLMPQHAALFVGDTLFARVARAVCAAGVLPRKELYEAWEVARRTHRMLRADGCPRLFDWACGHGLLASLLALLFPHAEVVAWDPHLPPSARKLTDALAQSWPHLQARVAFASSAPALRAGDAVVSCHACGALTDDVIASAIVAGAHVVVLPCCHHHKSAPGLAVALLGWMEPALAIDSARAHTLMAAGYRVATQTIALDVTPKNRLLLAHATPHRQAHPIDTNDT